MKPNCCPHVDLSRLGNSFGSREAAEPNLNVKPRNGAIPRETPWRTGVSGPQRCDYKSLRAVGKEGRRLPP
jgi:hypothetical protein